MFDLWRKRKLIMSKIPGHTLNPNGHLNERVRIGTKIENVNDFIGRMINGKW